MNLQGSKNLDEYYSGTQGQINYYYHHSDDWVLKSAVVKSLALYSRVPLTEVTVTVMEGYVILNGIVPHIYQKIVTRLMVQNIPGLRGIINNIKVIS